MPIKIKEKQGNKAIVRCSNPMELQWWLQIQANMRNPDGKINPLVSVQNIKGEEVQVPKPIQRPMTMNPAPQQSPFSGGPPTSVIPQSGHSGDPNIRTLPVEIVTPKPIEGTPVDVCGDYRGAVQEIAQNIGIGKAVDAVQKMVEEKKNEGQQPSPSVDEGKTG